VSTARTRVTLATIADRLGVSVATVSNAYNHPTRLSGALRERIFAVAAELGYPGPDAAARTLRRGVTDTVGVLLGVALSDALEDPAKIAFLRGLAEASGPAGLALHLIPSGDAALVQNAVVDAFVICSLPVDHPLMDAVRRRGVPVVVLDDDAAAGLEQGRRCVERLRRR